MRTIQTGEDVTLKELEETHIKALLEKYDRVDKIAAILDIDEATLYRKRKRMGLTIRQYAVLSR